jgi:hypothetical protein
MLEAVQSLQTGQPPRAAGHPEAYRVRSGGAIAPADVPLAQVMRTRFGHEHGLTVDMARTLASA